MKLHTADIPATIIAKASLLKRYRVMLFVVFVFGLYGYVVFQINQAAAAQPDAAQQTAAKSVTPHIDQTVVKQLQQLQDNSVSAKALFNEARTNPFQ